MREFIQHKLTTLPTEHAIPNAISLKFFHRDPAFFKSFTNNKRTTPAHQTEYSNLLTQAIDTYKSKNNIILTNKATRDAIQSKLRQKIAIDYLTNLNFRHMEPYHVSQMIKYCRNFSKAKLIENPKAIQDTTNQAYDSLKKILPETPQKIDTETVEILPFNLPITKRSQTGIIVKAL